MLLNLIPAEAKLLSLKGKAKIAGKVIHPLFVRYLNCTAYNVYTMKYQSDVLIDYRVLNS